MTPANRNRSGPNLTMRRSRNNGQKILGASAKWVQNGGLDRVFCHPRRGMTGVTVGKEVFTDLEFADDVSSLAEMLEVLVLALTVMQEEASSFGPYFWSADKLVESHRSLFHI